MRIPNQPPLNGLPLTVMSAVAFLIGFQAQWVGVLRQEAHAAPPAALPGAAAPNSQQVLDSRTSLVLPQDRQLEQWLESARKCISSSDFGSAAVLLQRVMNATDDSFAVLTGGKTFTSVRRQASELANLLPDEPRARFDVEFDRSAIEIWMSVKQNGSVEDIAAFANRYQSSKSGLEALRTLAAAHRDAGHHLQAALGWQAVARNPRATKSQKVTAYLASIDSLLLAGDRKAAEQAASDFHGADDDPIRIGGTEVQPSVWLARRLRQAQHGASVGKVPAEPAASRVPASEPVWTRETLPVGDLHKSLAHIQRYYREQGIVSSQLIRPLVSGNIAVTRTIQDINAFDIHSGEPLWSIPNHEYGWISKNPAILENGSFRTANASAWHRRTEADSVFGSLTTNGRLLVVVQEPDRSNLDFPASNSLGRPPVTGHVTNTRWNRLCGYDISTRELRWQIGGPPTGPADVFGGMTFLAGPLFVDDLLFVVARCEDDLRLLAIDHETGHSRWSVKLGVLAPHMADAISRRRIACPVTLCEGLIVCPTASGMLIAVNATTRSIDWARRYPVQQHDLPPRPGNGIPTVSMPDVWWNEWREVACHYANATGREGQIVVMASPDSPHLHAMNLTDGSALWSVPRGGALHFAGIAADVAVVIEPMAARGHDLETGRLLWRAETGEISGRGSLAGTQLLQPRRAGGLAIVDLADGSQRSRPGGSDSIYGTLVPVDGGWLTLIDQSLQRLPLQETTLRKAEAQWKSQPTEQAAVELARLHLESGDPIVAKRRLDGINSVDAKELRREAILETLRMFSSAAGAARTGELDRAELGRELMEICETSEEHLIAFRVQGDAARVAGDLRGAIKFYLAGLNLVDELGMRSIGYWSADAVSVRTVRTDRVLLGGIQQTLNAAQSDNPSADSPRLQQLEAELDARLNQARQDEDPFAVQRLLDRLLPLDWARRALLTNQTAALYARSLQEVEPILLSAAGSSDPKLSAQLLELLSDVQMRSGWKSDAESILRCLLAEHPGMPLSNGQTLGVSLSNPGRAELRNRLLAPVRDPWPARLPNVERESARHHDVYYMPVRVQASPGSPLEGLDVSVERGGRSVRFASAGHAGTWEKTLPNKPKVLRSSFANADQIEAHGVGRLLVLRVGSEVFRVLPFNERGEPRAELTDQGFDIAPDTSNLPSETWYPELVPARVGIRHEGVRLVDGFGRTFEGLGPVRAGYLCYRSQSRLVAVDTQTGRRLWERLDLAPNCRLLGDDDFLYLWRPDEGLVQTVSVIDGHTVRERRWDVGPDELLMQRGGFAWSVERTPITSVTLHDLRRGSVVWSRDFEKNAIPFAMDQSTLGVVEPQGLLHLLAADTGAPLGEALTIEVPDRVERIVCLHDAQRWYVAVSGPVSRLPILQSDQLWGGSRVVFVNGWLYGIERKSAEITWRRYLESEALPRHATQVAPVIVQLWRRPAVDGGNDNAVLGTLRFLDKRTGREILTHRDATLYPYSVLLPTENHERLEFHTERETFRLNYNPSPDTKQERATNTN